MTDPYGPNVISLLNFDSDYSDFTGRTWTPNGSVSISTSTKKFGAGSLYIPSGASHYLQSADSSDWAFGLNNFTIECWINRFVVSANDHCVIGNIDFSDVGWLFGINAADRVVWRSNQSNGANRVSSTTALDDNTWYHIAVTRDFGTVRIFVNGVLEGTGTDTQDLTGTVGAGIGRANYFIYQYGGYIDDLRVTRGVARYTTNFTPPTQAYTDPYELTISDVTDPLRVGNTGNITGEGLTGLTVQLGDASTVGGSSILVPQTVTGTSATLASIQVSAGALPDGPVYLFGENTVGQANSTGYAVTLETPVPLSITPGPFEGCNLATRKMMYRLIAQYPTDSKFAQMLKAIGKLYDELDDILTYLMFARYLDTAQGIWLDRIGVILGYPRPFEERTDVFTYRAVGGTSSADKGFGTLSSPLTGGAYSSISGLFTDTPIDDETYRALLGVRAKSINSDPSIPAIYTWITDSFGVECTLSVPSAGTIHVDITSGTLTANERYLIQYKSPAMPGVTVLLIS